MDTGVARQLSFSPDGRLLAVPAGSRLIIYDAHSLAELHFIDPQVRKESPPLITSLAFSPDGTVLAAGFEDGPIRLWEPLSGTLSRVLQGHTDMVIALAFSADGATLASASYDSTVRLWRVADGVLLRTQEGFEPKRTHPEVRHCRTRVAFSPDGVLVAWGCAGKVGVYSVGDGTHLRNLYTPEAVHALAFSSDGTMLAASTPKRIRVWRLDATGRLSVQDLAYGGPESLAFSADGQLLARGGYQGAGLLSLANGKHVLVLCCKHKKNIYAIGLSPDGSLLVTGSEDGVHCFWGLQP